MEPDRQARLPDDWRGIWGRGRCPDVSTDMLLIRMALPRQVAVLSEGSLCRWRWLKRLEELPRYGQTAVPKMIDALVERSTRREGG